MEINGGLNCCGLNELHGIDEYSSPKHAMVDFICELQENTDQDDDYGYYSFYNRRSSFDETKRKFKPAAFYVFTSLLRDGKNRPKRNYGENFATYIVEHKLGNVLEAPARYNRVNEPTHLLKAWLWTPSVKGLQTWWKEINKEEDKS